MKEIGIVRKVENGIIRVEVIAPKACAGCKKCGSAFPKEFTVKAETLPGAKADDEVEIEIPGSSLLKVYLFLYGLPLFLFVSIVAVIYHFTSNPLVSFIPAFAASLAACYFALLFMRHNPAFVPTVRRANP